MPRESLPLVALSENVILPHMQLSLILDTEDLKKGVQAAFATDKRVYAIPQIRSGFSLMGTICTVDQMATFPNGQPASIISGLNRARFLKAFTDEQGILRADVEIVEEVTEYSNDLQSLLTEYRATIELILERRNMGQIVQSLRSIDNPGHLADLAGYAQDLSLSRKIELLETERVEDRLKKLAEWFRQILQEINVKEVIAKEVSGGMERNQREFILRQEMEAIKRELGEGGNAASEYRRRLDEAVVPEHILAVISKEIDRLERMNEQNPEHGWIRNYIDWMLDMPWSSRTPDSFDLAAARTQLDTDHSGLDEVKDRIIEFLAVRKRLAEKGVTLVNGGGGILCLVGPPGVGKTSLGESVAKALGRKFTRISLGGVHDEAEIRGHRRTYVGAMPGRLARALKEVGTKNPVIMLDEVDKLGHDFRGDPASALLEVLDPAQNHTFRDHYLDVDLDLSEVLFIPTANISDNIPSPLLDRMELIRLDGYSEPEKLSIAFQHLLPRQLERNGLEARDVEILPSAMNEIIAGYTREAGVRSLEREIGKVLRKVATKLETIHAKKKLVISDLNIPDYLGVRTVRKEFDVPPTIPGVVTGLAVTGFGGDVLQIEASCQKGQKSNLILTGQLGDVMKESAQIALSFVRSHAESLKLSIPEGEIHIHVPAGAVPKDGPSAGLAMVTALVSLFSSHAVRPHVAMTGEVTLQGRALAIGGVKQKVLAAERAGITEVILPLANESDLKDLPEAIRAKMTFHLVENASQTILHALEPAAWAAA